MIVIHHGRILFDGQLEYHPGKNRFLLFYNTKYDDPLSRSEHPRTRFSFAHELGHYFIERHRSHLLLGGSTHGSKSEFFTGMLVEREADSFAAGLLMPSRLMRREVNSGELTLRRLGAIATAFNTSLVSTSIRSVQLSDFPCAVVGIRNARVAWSFLSPAFKAAGCYPLEAGDHLPSSARRIWDQLTTAPKPHYGQDGLLHEWFRTYDREQLVNMLVYVDARWVATMETLVVLVTADESDLACDADEEDA